jgi:photosystem II stability/assembly factor-like uncharacterized protein
VSAGLASIFFTLLSATWTPADLPVGPVADVAAHPRIGGLVFASTSSGIYRSTDSGTRWQRVTDAPLNTLALFPVHALAFNPFDDRDLCALGDSFLSCTTDFGVTWNPFPQPGLNFLLFDPTVRDRMFTGTAYGNDWLYVSNDHGRTWNALGSHEVHPWFHSSAAVDRRSGSLLENGSPHGICIPVCSLFRSDDGGSTWREIVASEDSWMLAEDRAGRSVLYVSSGAISASANLGITFETRGTAPFTVNSLAADPNNVATIYAGGGDGIVQQSVDGGRHWSRIDRSEIRDPSDLSSRITHVSIGIDGVVYVATQNRVFVRAAGRRRRAAAH